jgi:hypothetical protein
VGERDLENGRKSHFEGLYRRRGASNAHENEGGSWSCKALRPRCTDAREGKGKNKKERKGRRVDAGESGNAAVDDKAIPDDPVDRQHSRCRSGPPGPVIPSDIATIVWDSRVVTFH